MRDKWFPNRRRHGVSNTETNTNTPPSHAPSAHEAHGHGEGHGEQKLSHISRLAFLVVGVVSSIVFVVLIGLIVFILLTAKTCFVIGVNAMTNATQQHVRTVPHQSVQQFPDRFTPCHFEIKEIRDLYTDGEPVYILPPGWSKKDAILYGGHGHLTIEGGNIHAGDWSFWAAGDDPNKVVLIRVLGK